MIEEKQKLRPKRKHDLHYGFTSYPSLFNNCKILYKKYERKNKSAWNLCYMYCNQTGKPRKSAKQCLQQQLHLYMYSNILFRWRNLLSSIFNALQHSWSMLDNASIKCLTRIRSEWVLQLDCNTQLMEHDALDQQLLNSKVFSTLSVSLSACNQGTFRRSRWVSQRTSYLSRCTTFVLFLLFSFPWSLGHNPQPSTTNTLHHRLEQISTTKFSGIGESNDVFLVAPLSNLTKEIGLGHLPGHFWSPLLPNI